MAYASNRFEELSAQDAPAISEALLRTCFRFGSGLRLEIRTGITDMARIGVALRVTDAAGRLIMEAGSPHQRGDYGFEIDMQSGIMQGIDVRVSENFRHRMGIGKAYVRGRVELANQLGLTEIHNTAGNEDGAYFWSRHGWRIKDKKAFDNMKHRLLDNLRYDYDGLFSKDQLRDIKSVFSKVDLYANQRLAAMKMTKDQIELLFGGARVPMVFDLEDRECLRIFRSAIDRPSGRRLAHG